MLETVKECVTVRIAERTVEFEVLGCVYFHSPSSQSRTVRRHKAAEVQTPVIRGTLIAAPLHLPATLQDCSGHFTIFVLITCDVYTFFLYICIAHLTTLIFQPISKNNLTSYLNSFIGYANQ